MPSLVSHQLSIIKYVVLKKIFFFLCFDRLIWTWTWTWTRTSLDSDSNLFGLGLDSDSNLFGLGLVLDSTKVDLTTALNMNIWSLNKLEYYLRPIQIFFLVNCWPSGKYVNLLYMYSILGRGSFCFNYCLNSVGMKVISLCHCWGGMESPCFFDSGLQLICIFWSLVSHFPLDNSILNGVQVWRAFWPVKHTNTMLI